MYADESVFFFSVCVGRSGRLPEARASSAFNQAPRADAALSDFIYTQLHNVSDVYFYFFHMPFYLKKFLNQLNKTNTNICYKTTRLQN